MSSHRLSFYDTNKGVCNLRTKNKMELTLILILKKNRTQTEVYTISWKGLHHPEERM